MTSHLMLLTTIIVLVSPLTLTQSVKAAKYSTVSFDTLANRLPAHFLGHNAKDLYWSMESKIGKSYKDEFETTEESKKRLRAEFSKPIIGSLDIWSVYAFLIHPLDASYDADNQTLTIRCPLSQSSSRRTPTLKSVSWKSEWTDKGSYIGTNAFGATIQVSTSTNIRYDIVLNNFSRFPLDSEWQSSQFDWFYQIKLHLVPSEARKKKLSVAVLIIGDIVEPYTSTDLTSLPATFHSPLDLKMITFNFHINVMQILFFDSETGDIITSIHPN